MNKWVISRKKCKYFGIRFLRLSCMVLCVTDFPQQHYIRTSRRGNRGWLFVSLLILTQGSQTTYILTVRKFKDFTVTQNLCEVTIGKIGTSLYCVVILPISECFDFDEFMHWKLLTFKIVTVAVFRTHEICQYWFDVNSDIVTEIFLNFHTVILTAELWSLRAKIKELQHSPP